MSRNLKNKITVSNATESAIQSVIHQAATLIADKKVDQAIGLLEDTAKSHPDNPQLPYLIGKHLIENKSAADGIKKLEENLDLFPEHLNTLLELGHTYLKPGNINKATPYFLKALEIFPKDPNVQLSLGSYNQRKGELPLAIEHYKKALELQLKYPITENEPSGRDDFATGKAEQLLWDTLELMAKNGVHMFPAFGTLLGLVRRGGLLLHDKDIDTGIPFSEMNRTINILKKNGWKEVNNSFGYINPRSFLNLSSEIVMDISGFTIDKESKKALTAGAWLPNTPKEWNLIFEFDEIHLKKVTVPNKESKIWFVDNPEKWLETVYGDWKIPDKNFDTMVRGKNIRSFSLLLQCFSYSRIFEQISKNDIPRALALTRSTLEKSTNDALLKKILANLEKRRK